MTLSRYRVKRKIKINVEAVPFFHDVVPLSEFTNLQSNGGRGEEGREMRKKMGEKRNDCVKILQIVLKKSK